MKNLLFFLTVSLFALASCNKDNSLDTTTSNATTSLSTRGGTVVDTVGVPQATKDFIATKYPGYSISVVESDTERNGTIVFEVQITNSTTKKYLVFDANWVFLNEETPKNCFNSISLDSIRQSFKDSVIAKYPGYTIKTVKRENQNGVLIYEVEITNASGRKSLIYDATWKFLMEEVPGNEGHGRGGPGNGGDPHGNGGPGFDHHDGNPNDTISLAVIPQRVKDSIAIVAGAGYTIVSAHTANDHNSNHYTIKVTNGTTTKILVYDVNWNYIAPLAVPTAATTYITTNFAGYIVANATKMTDKNGVVTYEVQIVNPTTHDRKELIFDANWAFLKLEH